MSATYVPTCENIYLSATEVKIFFSNGDAYSEQIIPITNSPRLP